MLLSCICLSSYSTRLQARRAAAMKQWADEPADQSWRLYVYINDMYIIYAYVYNIMYVCMYVCILMIWRAVAMKQWECVCVCVCVCV
jgi:hypothetical protein